MALAVFSGFAHPDVSIDCGNRDWTVSGAWGRAEDGADVLTLDGRAAQPHPLPSVKLLWRVPAVDIASRWAEFWGPQAPALYGSSFSCWTPIWGFRGASDVNRGMVSCSDAASTVLFGSDVDEATAEHRCQATWTGSNVQTQATFRVQFRFDNRRVPGFAAVADAAKWINRAGGYVPMPAPTAAFGPVYSTWYAFHKDVTAEKVEKAAAEAAKLGMKTIIVDDGWQTEGTKSGYEACGDWKPAPSKFPDMKAHVARVQALGLKYVLWYAVPFMGEKCPLYEAFKHTFMGTSFKGRVGVMDPRFPEVRTHIVETLARAAEDWGVDGFKVDFIGRYNMSGTTPKPDFDGAGLQEGVEALMAGIAARLRAINPDVLIEFRQEYVGSAIVRYGNMLRCSDCCCWTKSNRNGIATMRLTAPASAIHSDMLAFNPHETPEDLSRSILDSIFGVIQYSPDFSSVTAEQRAAIGHWVRFSRAHEDALLHGTFRTEGSGFNYTALEGEGTSERVRAVYAPGTVSEAGRLEKPLYLLNGTGAAGLVVGLDVAADARISDACGRAVASRRIPAGLNRLEVPVGGCACLTAATDVSQVSNAKWRFE